MNELFSHLGGPMSLSPTTATVGIASSVRDTSTVSAILCREPESIVPISTVAQAFLSSRRAICSRCFSEKVEPLWVARLHLASPRSVQVTVVTRPWMRSAWLWHHDYFTNPVIAAGFTGHFGRTVHLHQFCISMLGITRGSARKLYDRYSSQVR